MKKYLDITTGKILIADEAGEEPEDVEEVKMNRAINADDD